MYVYFNNNKIVFFFWVCSYSLLFILAQEKQLVDEVFQNAMDVLTEEDRHLPQVDNLLPLLRRGMQFLFYYCLLLYKNCFKTTKIKIELNFV